MNSFSSAFAVVRLDPSLDQCPRLLGRSRAMDRVRAEIETLARCSLPILVHGETGTGKDLVARSLHAASDRARGPFVAVNCAAIPHELLESDLFGHEKGAFTGALSRRRGRLERASGGTIFLDEIGDMSLTLQAKLLRALQEQEIERVGSEQVVRIDVRVVSATNRDLHAQMTAGEFREDLYYRLAGAEIELPPLRARGGDIALLARHFAEEIAASRGREIELPAEFIDALAAYHWPGNVRELVHAIELAVQRCDEKVAKVGALPRRVRRPTGQTKLKAVSPCRFPTLAQAELEHIGRAMDLAGGNKSEAARLLGIHRNSLARKLHKARAVLTAR